MATKKQLKFYKSGNRVYTKVLGRNYSISGADVQKALKGRNINTLPDFTSAISGGVSSDNASLAKLQSDLANKVNFQGMFGISGRAIKTRESALRDATEFAKGGQYQQEAINFLKKSGAPIPQPFVVDAPQTGFQFRPRRAGESMSSYLKERQSAGDTSIKIPQPIQQVPQSTGAQAVTSQSQPTQIQPPTMNLQPGDRGENVRQLQNYLVSQGYMTQAEMDTGPGIFGPRTKKAVTGLQQARGVDNTTGQGFYGPRTRAGITQQQGTQPQARTQAPIDATTLQTGQVPFTPRTTPQQRPIDTGGVPTIQKQPEVLPETAKETQTRTLLEQAQGLLGKTGGVAQAQVDAEKQFKIQEIEKQRQNILNRIKATDVQATEEKSRAENRLAPTLAITGEQAAIDRAIAVKQLKLNAQFQAVSGDLTQALDYADRKVAAEFNPIKEQLDITLRNLDLLSALPDLTQAERQQVADRKAKILADKQKVEDDEEDAKTIGEMTIQAIANGANEATQRALEKAETPTEAARIIADAGLSVGGELTVDTVDGFKVLRDAEGNVLSTVKPSVTSGTGEGFSSSVEGWASLLSGGQATISNVPTKIRDAVVKYLDTNSIDIKKQMSPTELSQVTQTESALASLDDLKKVIQQNLQFVGPIKGIKRFNPWSDARKAQADIDRVRQTVGKALEGGVLRKEDEEKYKKILATLADTPETALYKIESLGSTLSRDLQNFKEKASEAGRFVPGVGKSTDTAENLRTKYNY